MHQFHPTNLVLTERHKLAYDKLFHLCSAYFFLLSGSPGEAFFIIFFSLGCLMFVFDLELPLNLPTGWTLDNPVNYKKSLVFSPFSTYYCQQKPFMKWYWLGICILEFAAQHIKFFFSSYLCALAEFFLVFAWLLTIFLFTYFPNQFLITKRFCEAFNYEWDMSLLKLH